MHTPSSDMSKSNNFWCTSNRRYQLMSDINTAHSFSKAVFSVHFKGTRKFRQTFLFSGEGERRIGICRWTVGDLALLPERGTGQNWQWRRKRQREGRFIIHSASTALFYWSVFCESSVTQTSFTNSSKKCHKESWLINIWCSITLYQ